MKKIKYEIRNDLFSLIPSGAALFIFGGATLLLKLSNNGMFLFTGFLSIAVALIIISVLYSHFFIKILIDETGFYYKKGILKAKYYKFSDVKEAWESSGRTRNGTLNYYLNFKTDDGTVKKFPFTADNAEGIDFLISEVMGDKTDEEQKY